MIIKREERNPNKINVSQLMTSRRVRIERVHALRVSIISDKSIISAKNINIFFYIRFSLFLFIYLFFLNSKICLCVVGDIYFIFYFKLFALIRLIIISF